MKKTAIFAIFVLFIAVLAGCMSEEQKALKKNVDEYAATLPQNVGAGISITDVSYSAKDSVVTLECEIDNSTIASAMGYASGLVKSMFVPYLKTNRANNDFINSLIAADASLKCLFFHGDEQIAEFVVEPSEID